VILAIFSSGSKAKVRAYAITRFTIAGTPCSRRNAKITARRAASSSGVPAQYPHTSCLSAKLTLSCHSACQEFAPLAPLCGQQFVLVLVIGG
jgi:hypothetical protein